MLICSEDMLLEYEQLFMDYYKPWYNMTLIAGRIDLSPEVIRKRADAQKRTLALPHQKERLRNKMLGDKNPAKRNEVREKIRAACRVETLSRAENHHMKRPEHRLRMKLENPGMRQSHRERMKKYNPSARSIIELGSEKIFRTMTDAANFYNLDISKIVAVCKGKRNHTGGYKFAYLEIKNAFA
jgi:hypothetical protein